MRNAERQDRAREVEVGARACASLAVKFGGYSVQDCENVFCSGIVGGVAGDD